ncbi:MAG TPA: cyclic nucleotide-binding domain-containing protein [Verrucomicrobiae bacterium]
MHAQLQGVPIFAGLSEEAIELLVKHAREIEVKAGDFIVREGESGNRFYLVGEGEVRVVKHAGTAHEVELAHLIAHDFFGEMCILETLPRSASVQTVTDAKVIALSSMDFLSLYKALPSEYGILILNLARDLSRRIRHLDELFAARN